MKKSVESAKRTSRWEVMSANVKPYLAEMPFLQEITGELDAVIVEAQVLNAEQERARARLQEAIRRRQQVEERGESLRRRMASYLQGVFGYTSEELVKFGVQPRKSGPRGPRVAR